jgi:tetratricopeptide (TPR) repeat protein
VVTSADSAARLASPVEVFYSYSHRDEKFRDELEKSLTMLKRDGIITGWHDRKIGGGEEWAGEIDEHINSARIILLLISADFLASDYCYDIEVKRAMERHEAGEALVIPVILRPVDWSSAPFGKLQGFPKDAKPITKWSNRDEAFKDVALGMRKIAEKLHAERLAAGPRLVAPAAKAGALPRIWNVPHSRNPNFTGREDLLKQLHDSLRSGKHAALTQALHGLGGIGKTQTATEYCYLNAADYDLVWWIRSEEPGKLAADYAGLANELGLAEKDARDQRITVQAVRAALARRTRWLLVFDNARGPEDVRDYLPQGNNGHVLVTSRNPAFGSVAHALPVPTMKTTEAVEFLLKRAPSADEKGAKALAEALGGLPLALEHAGAYVEEHGANFSGYLQLFRKRQKGILGRAHAPVGYEATVSTTWEISFIEVEKESEAAGQLMNLCAFLAPDDIGREMLRGGAEELPEPLAKAVADDLQWNDAVGALRKHSLIEVQGGTISVHRLVQAVVRDRLDEERRKKWAEAAVRVVNAAFPYKRNDVKTWAPSSRLLPHALASAGFGEELQVALKTCSRLLNEVGLYLSGRAEFSAAKSVHERSVRIDEAAYGADHPEVAIDLNNLGLVLEELGDFAGAQACFERSLRIGEAAYGPDHPKVAIRVNNLGNALQDQGDLAGARACYERALKINEATYGPDHPTTAIRVNNLGVVLKDQGDLVGARACFERALKIQEAAYGPDHPSVAIDVSNLGGVLKDQGDLTGARACFERALKIDEAAYGPAHPTVAIRLNNLGLVLRDQEDLAQARTCIERALRIFEQALGKYHPSTRTARGWLESLG